MCGNIASVLLWLLATDFRTFLLSRIVGGLSEGNVQIATAIATDISDEKQRGATMALVGGCFSIAFTFGPALGAYLSTISLVSANPFATAAGFSLFLIVVETLYLYACLPETHLTMTPAPKERHTPSKPDNASPTYARTNSHLLLNSTHLLFILVFSGMEFSITFMTHDLFHYSAASNGRLLGYIGLVASLLQGGVTRRLAPLSCVRIGVVSCFLAFVLLSSIKTVAGLYVAATLLAVTTATVVTGLNALSSFEAGKNERGGKLGNLRSWGQIGRAIGPLTFCSLYWWAGRETAYQVGATAMAAVVVFVFAGLKDPRKAENAKKDA